MRAFSLVELSIVLVILGLLTGGILTGQSLIRAAELRAITGEYQRYVIAVASFRDKYAELPGDLPDATRFWSRQVSASHCAANGSPAASVATPGTCDGDGNGILEHAAAASQSGERFQFWRQLALAGLIEGSYDGLAGSEGYSHTLGGRNAPFSRIANSVWSANHYGHGYAGNTTILAGYYGHFLFVGRQSDTAWPSERILTPEEMWNIDRKLDDGKPARGKIITFWWNDCGTGSSQSDYDAEYDLPLRTKQCTPIFREAF